MQNKNWILVLAILILISSLYVASLDGYLSIYGDNAVFIILAKSMLTQHGYRLISMSGDPPHTQFPFVLPALLMPIVAFFGMNFLVMEILITIIAIASIFLIWYFFHMIGNRANEMTAKIEWVAIIVAVLSGLSPYMGEFTHTVMSEFPYVLFSFLAIIFLTKYQKQERWLTKSGFAAAIFVTLAYFTRSIGLFMFIGGLVYILLEGISTKYLRLRLKKALLIVLIFIIPAAAWEYRNRTVTGDKEPPYVKQFFMKDPYTRDLGTAGLGDLAKRAWDNHRYYKQVFAAVTINYRYILPSLESSVSIVIFCLILFGYFCCVIKHRTVVDYIVPLYMLIIYMWPWRWIRLIMPIIPFLLYYLIISVKVLLSAISKLRRDILVYIFILPILLIFLYPLHTYIKPYKFSPVTFIILAVCSYLIMVIGRMLLKIPITKIAFILLVLIMIGMNLISTIEANVLSAHRTPYYRGQWGEYYEMSQWIRGNTPLDSVIMSRKPELFYLWTGRKQSIYPFTYDKKAVIDSIRNNMVSYIAVDSFTWTPTTSRYLIPALEEQMDKLALVYQVGKSKMYKVVSTL